MVASFNNNPGCGSPTMSLNAIKSSAVFTSQVNETHRDKLLRFSILAIYTFELEDVCCQSKIKQVQIL